MRNPVAEIVNGPCRCGTHCLPLDLLVWPDVGDDFVCTSARVQVRNLKNLFDVTDVVDDVHGVVDETMQRTAGNISHVRPLPARPLSANATHARTHAGGAAAFSSSVAVNSWECTIALKSTLQFAIFIPQ